MLFPGVVGLGGVSATLKLGFSRHFHATRQHFFKHPKLWQESKKDKTRPPNTRKAPSVVEIGRKTPEKPITSPPQGLFGWDGFFLPFFPAEKNDSRQGGAKGPIAASLSTLF